MNIPVLLQKGKGQFNDKSDEKMNVTKSNQVALFVSPTDKHKFYPVLFLPGPLPPFLLYIILYYIYVSPPVKL
jgi:hypothetical protein